MASPGAASGAGCEPRPTDRQQPTTMIRTTPAHASTQTMLAQLCIQRECPDQGITQTGYPDEGPRTIPAYGLGRIQVVKASASAGGPSKVNRPDRAASR